jgi:hypothetical protein
LGILDNIGKERDGGSTVERRVGRTTKETPNEKNESLDAR